MASGASKGAKKIYPFNDGVLIGVNQGPSTPIKYYEGMGYAPNLGAGRIKNVRPKGKQKL